MTTRVNKFTHSNQSQIKHIQRKITLEGLKSPTHNNIPTSKVEFGSFWPKTFSVFRPFQAVALAQSLNIARSTTTVSGRLYGVGRIILVCNAYAVTIFWLYFLVFFAYFSRCIGSIHLKLPGAYVQALGYTMVQVAYT